MKAERSVGYDFNPFDRMSHAADVVE